MKLIAVTELRYAGVTYHPGDPFEGSDNDALLLKTIGKAKDAPEKPVQVQTVTVSPPLAQRSIEPAKMDVSSQTSEEKQTTRRRYMRRDMTAEE